MLYELNDALDRAARDSTTKVIVVAADGVHFSSGHDLRDRAKLDEFDTVLQFGDFDAPGQEGYMAQEQETLDFAATPLQLIRDAAPLNETEARSFLHYFLFAGDAVFTPVGRLSYGERSRLALALLAVRGCNFLLLDEPINHLDIPSRESFERAMARFEGTVLAVVHDRYFIERFAETLWSVDEGEVMVLAA